MQCPDAGFNVKVQVYLFWSFPIKHIMKCHASTFITHGDGAHSATSHENLSYSHFLVRPRPQQEEGVPYEVVRRGQQ